MTKKTILPFGMWPSPISAAMISQRVRIDELQWSEDGSSILYLEQRGDQGTLYEQPLNDARREMTDGFNVRGGIGYGGGEFTAAGGALIFTNRNGQLFRRSLAYGRPHPITPPFGAAAAPALSPDGRWVMYVHSDGQTDGIALVESGGDEWPQQLVRGADFYMQPVWHPAGQWIAWVEWDHPNMPWDGTRLMLARAAGSPPQLSNVAQIAGGDEVAVCQPRFSPDGRFLTYLEGNGEWERLVLYNLKSGTRTTLVEGDGFTISTPAWVQGIHSYGWSHTGQRIFYLRNFAGTTTLWQVELAGGQSTQIDTAPYTWLSQLAVSPLRDELAFMASAGNQPARLVRWDGHSLHTLARTDPESLDPASLTLPQDITWQAPDGTTVHGLYYPPFSEKFTGGGLPPAIVNIHGGPTSAATTTYSSEACYFTSRGYAYLEVNYRGSTGYGRSYMRALYDHWGHYDSEDAAFGAKALIDQRLADPKRLVIKGGSAGGFTVLNVLVHRPGTFKAGLCLYGVSNLFNLAMDTHKFEARYTDKLVGVLPETAGRYQAYSAAFHAVQIRDALAIFQGADDRVVPPSQSEEIVKALRERNIPHLYRLYPGEGHGFRRPENLLDFWQQVERFLQQNVLFSA